jgi:hypothetical protein
MARSETARRSLALHVPTVDPRTKGRMLTPEDVIAMYPAGKGGRKPSRWTIMNTFLQDKKRRTGRSVWWWESDVLAYFDGAFAEAV